MLLLFIILAILVFGFGAVAKAVLLGAVLAVLLVVLGIALSDRNF